MYQRDIYLDIDDNLNNYIKSVELDSNSRVWHFHLTADYEPLDLTGKSVQFRAEKPDKTNVLNECRIVDAEKGVVEVKLTRQVNAIPGHVKCLLKIIGDEEFVLKTKTFVVDVSKTLSDDAIVSSDEFSALEAALGKVQDIDNRFAQTNAQLSKNKKELDNRIDSIIALPDGSTTADAELVDIRIGADGTTYSSAGESIRTQFNDKISIYRRPVELNQKNSYINTSGTSVEDNRFEASDFILIEAGDYIDYKNVRGSTKVSCICQYDLNKKFVKSLVEGDGYDSTNIKNGNVFFNVDCYVRVCSYISDALVVPTFSVRRDYMDEIDKIHKMNKDMVEFKDEIGNDFEKTVKGFMMVSDAEDIYIDMDNVPNNVIVRYTTGDFVNGPNITVYGGTLITYAYNNELGIGGRVQTFYGSNNSYFTRIYWSNEWTKWSEHSSFDSIGTVVDNSHQYYDADNIDFNGAIRYGNSGVNLPNGSGVGTLYSMIGDSTVSNGRIQVFINSSNEMYHRIYWSSWKPWIKEFKTSDYEYDKNNNFLIASRRITSLDQYDDFDKIPANTIYLITIPTLANSPEKSALGNLVTLNEVSGSADVNGIVQTYTTNTGNIYTRIRWSNKWSDWKKLNSDPAIETNVDTKDVYDFSMFESIGVIGDSYASGNFGETSDATSSVDHYAFSWPQMIGRRCGVNVTNYTRGGLSTRTWLTDSKGLSLLKSDTPKNLYILALERNDYNIENRGESGYIGSINDIATKSDTFYGNYARIIEEIQAHAPHAKIIMMTGDYVSSNTLGTAYNEAVKEIASHYNLPCMVQLDHPFFSSDLYRKNWPAGGHPGISQYNGMSRAIESMFSKAVEENLEYFRYFIG